MVAVKFWCEGEFKLTLSGLMIDGEAVPEYGRTHLVGVLTGVVAASLADLRLLQLEGRERNEAGGLMAALLAEFVEMQTSELAGKGACMVGTACQTTLVVPMPTP